MTAPMFSKVLVICIGNICRSPMAAAMLRQQGPAGLQVRSAGLAACVGQDMDPLALQVLGAEAVEHLPHSASQLTEAMLRWADLVLVMDHQQWKSVTRHAPYVLGKTFLIGKWRDDLEIADPYRRPLSAFQQTYAHLGFCIEGWLPYLSFEDQEK